MRKEEVRAIYLRTQKVRFSKLNTYRTFAYSLTYLKMLSTAKNHRQQTVCGIKSEVLLLFLLLKNPSSPSTKPPTTLYFLMPSVTATVTTQLKQLST